MRKSPISNSVGLLAACCVLSAGAIAAETPASSPVASEFDNGYVTFRSADGNYALKLDGRIQLDFGDIQADKNPSEADTGFRRIRLGLKSKLWQDWDAEFDVDFAGEEANAKDMWLAYTGLPNWNFKVGNFKPHFSIDQVESSRFATFLEASIATDSIATSRRIGFAADYTNDLFFVGGGFFGDKVNDSNDEEDSDNPDGADKAERFGYSARGIFRPYFNEEANNLFHVGVNYLNQQPRTISTADRKDGSIKFSVVNENELDETEYLDTGRMYGVEDSTSVGIEAAGKFSRSILIAEYIETTVKFDSTDYKVKIPDASFNGYYIAYSYFLSGERKYDSEGAEFSEVSGKNALELTARFSNADLNDPTGGNTKKRSATEGATVVPTIGIKGGEADITTIGFNWYPNPNLMLRVDYLMIQLDRDADANGDAIGGDNIDVLGARVQFTF